MTRQSRSFAKRYRAALQAHLARGPHAALDTARGLGVEALAAGVQALDLAKLHELTLVDAVLPASAPRRHAALIRRAGMFFAAAMIPPGQEDHTAGELVLHLKMLIEALSLRSVELAASNQDLNLEIQRRKTVEDALKANQAHSAILLAGSDRMQEQLRLLSRQVISCQEDERRLISRELHDVIAQTLTGINLRLASLKSDSALNSKNLDRNIARTQRLVERSVDIVHRFARELRPAILDDLGLVPALTTFMKAFTARTGIHARLTPCPGVERLDMDRRTVFFRVVQEALTNVARHAKATRVTVTLAKAGGDAVVEIHDDGRSFQVERILHARGGKRLGLLGMRERLEMVGGTLAITSAVGRGTTITGRIPLVAAPRDRSARSGAPAGPPGAGRGPPRSACGRKPAPPRPRPPAEAP